MKNVITLRPTQTASCLRTAALIGRTLARDAARYGFTELAARVSEKTEALRRQARLAERFELAEAVRRTQTDHRSS